MDSMGRFGLVLLISGTIWAIGYIVQRRDDLFGVCDKTIPCRSSWCRLFGASQERGLLYIRPASLQLVGLIGLLGGLVELLLCGTLRSQACSLGAMTALGLVWAIIDVRRRLKR